MPQLLPSPASKRSVLNGMRNSAVHPSAVLRASTHHTASQLGLTSRPFVGDLRVGLRALRVGREDEAVAAIGKRIEQHLERVLIAAGEVLADLVDDDAGGIGVAAERADVEIVGVVGDAHFGDLGGRLAFVRIGLDEVRGRHRARPDLFVERAVDHDWRRCWHGLQLSCARPATGSLSGRTPRTPSRATSSSESPASSSCAGNHSAAALRRRCACP